MQASEQGTAHLQLPGLLLRLCQQGLELGGCCQLRLLPLTLLMLLLCPCRRPQRLHMLPTSRSCAVAGQGVTSLCFCSQAPHAG